MEWPKEATLRLRNLWDQGLSTAEIGRRLGISKNAIVGKAHRLDLTARPSPIRRKPPAQHREQKPRSIRPGSATLPVLPSSVVEASAAFAASVPPPLKTTDTRLRAAEVVVRLPTAPPRPGPAGRRGIPTCMWPIGEPGKKDFRFCDGASTPGKPYCDEHVKLAYVKIRDRKEDAA